MSGPPDAGRNPYTDPIGDERSQIQRIIASNLRRIPGMESVSYEESGTGVEYQVVGHIDTTVFGNALIQAEEAHIQANWWPLDEFEDRQWWEFHYYDSSGFDCGWHRHDNDHVDGSTHYQERTSSDSEYEYHEFQPEYATPAGLVWEIVDGRLPIRLDMRYADD